MKHTNQSKQCNFCGKTYYRQTWRNDRMWNLQTVCSPECSEKLTKSSTIKTKDVASRNDAPNAMFRRPPDGEPEQQDKL